MLCCCFVCVIVGFSLVVVAFDFVVCCLVV